MSRGRADGVRRHRSAAHRRRGRHARAFSVRPDRSAIATVRGRRTIVSCRGTRRAGVITAGAATSATGAWQRSRLPRSPRRCSSGWARGDDTSDCAASRRYGSRSDSCPARWRSGWRIRRPRASRSAAPWRVAGEAIRIWAAGHLEKGREVTTSGRTRSRAIRCTWDRRSSGSVSRYASAKLDRRCRSSSPTWLITLTAAIRTEEAHLTEKFGAAYPAYRAGHE